jgi:hypothetical protein
MAQDKIIYDWGLYNVADDDHFEFEATPQQIAEAMPDPDISVRLIRYDRNGDWEDCYIGSDGTFEHDGFFLCGCSNRKVPKRYVEQAARWVSKYGYECREA